jgi:hypothetical protein
MDFNPSKYGAEVARILALDEDGRRLRPLHLGPCSSREPIARCAPDRDGTQSQPEEVSGFRSRAAITGEARGLLRSFAPAALFPSAGEPESAMAGLWLYFFCFDEAHDLANDCKSEDGSLWHAILHRLEGDMGNAAYWFRKAGHHPVYRELAAEANEILRRYPRAEFRVGRWDPFAFISFCDRARQQPGSDQERVAMEIQRAEWQLLFDYCAIPQRSGRGSLKPSRIFHTLDAGPAQ